MGEERFRALFECSPDLTLVLDDELRIISATRASRSILGLDPEDVVGRCLDDIVHPSDIGRVRATIAPGSPRGEPATVESRWRHVDGSWRSVDAMVTDLRNDEAIRGIMFCARDVTGRNRVERELRQSQKLESVGQLASGIAHEINTPVQFVGDNLKFVEEGLGKAFALLEVYRTALAPDAPAMSWAERTKALLTAEQTAELDYFETELPLAVAEAASGINQIATIVRAMRAFGHPDGATQRPADLNECLSNTLVVARNELKYVARVEVELGADLPLVTCYPSEINQVFLNLLVNAAHAISEKVEGTDELGRIDVRSAVDGDDVVVSIGDTGTGIPEHLQERIFDPFFTTKDVGHGTGQGLALARSVVIDRHGGSLTFESTEGLGTTFFLRLPIGGIHHTGT